MKEECTFEGCYRERYATGLCLGHYGQNRRGGPLKPLRRYRRIVAGTKECSRCGLIKRVPEDYYMVQGTNRTQSGWCTACTATVSLQKRSGASNRKDVGQESTQLKEALRTPEMEIEDVHS